MFKISLVLSIDLSGFLQPLFLPSKIFNPDAPVLRDKLYIKTEKPKFSEKEDDSLPGGYCRLLAGYAENRKMDRQYKFAPPLFLYIIIGVAGTLFSIVFA